jgi:hypothetical protein
MTLWSLNTRDSVREGEVERRLRRTETAGRRIAASFGGRSSSKLLCRIRWNITASGDQSDGDVVNAAGTSLGRTVTVDAFQSLQAVRPEYFGDVIYECEPIGLVTSTVPTSKRRMNVRAVRLFGFGAGTHSRPYEVAVTAVPGGTSIICKPYDSGGVLIQTSVGGVLQDNAVNLHNGIVGVPPTSFRFDTQMPVQWSIDGTAVRLVPDIMQTGHRTGVASNSAGAGTSLTISGLSIDFGEAFQLRIFGHNNISGTTTFAAETLSIADLQIRRTGAAALQVKGVVAGRGINSQAATPAPSSVVAGGGMSTISASANAFTFSFWFANVTPTVAQSVTMTVTLTIDAAGRVTDVGVTSSLSVHLAMIILGGRSVMASFGLP